MRTHTQLAAQEVVSCDSFHPAKSRRYSEAAALVVYRGQPVTELVADLDVLIMLALQKARVKGEWRSVCKFQRKTWEWPEEDPCEQPLLPERESMEL